MVLLNAKTPKINNLCIEDLISPLRPPPYLASKKKIETFVDLNFSEFEDSWKEDDVEKKEYFIGCVALR